MAPLRLPPASTLIGEGKPRISSLLATIDRQRQTSDRLLIPAFARTLLYDLFDVAGVIHKHREGTL